MKHFKLNEFTNDPGFKVPENYFETLSEKVQQKLDAPERPVISMVSSKKWILVAAAILVLSLLIPFSMKNLPAKSEPDVTSIEHYLALQTEISVDDIAVNLDIEDIESLEIDYGIEDKELEETLTGTSIENYLIN